VGKTLFGAGGRTRSSPSPILPRYSLYNIGQDVEQYYAKAKYCYEQAAEQSHAQAQKNLGVMYDGKGNGVDQDYD
jgi:TPR repeat protein